jgi:hypothetical protein
MLLDFVIIMSRNRVPFMNYVPGDSNTPVPERRPPTIRTFEDYQEMYRDTVNNYMPSRHLEQLQRLTYIDKSTGHYLNAMGQFVGFGNGLYIQEGVVIPANSLIAVFQNGILRTHDDYNERVQLGFGGYAIHLNSVCVLDCYDSLTCNASIANSSCHAIDIWGNDIMPNATMHISQTHFGYVSLYSSKELFNYEEVFYDYGSTFIYPDGFH